MTNAEADAIIRLYAADILASEGMAEQQTFVQHGSVTVYDHSLGVARACLAAGKVLPLSLDVRSLVRGALLHDYFGYDWHEHSERSKGHALHHARRAADRALNHFSISELEYEIVSHHMFPLVPLPPRHAEAWVLCLADKAVALRETLGGLAERLGWRA